MKEVELMDGLLKHTLAQEAGGGDFFEEGEECHLAVAGGRGKDRERERYNKGANSTFSVENLSSAEVSNGRQ